MSSNVQVVVDTNIFISAIMRKNTAPREIIRRCLAGKINSLMGTALFLEYESVVSRSVLFKNAPLNVKEREELLNAFLSVSQWVSTYYLWRPNLKDEADNHLIELAVAGNAEYIITRNKKDFRDSELLFPEIQIVDAGEFLLKEKE